MASKKNKNIKSCRFQSLYRRDFLKKMGSVLLTSAACTSGVLFPKTTCATPIVRKQINIGTFGPSHCATPFVYAKLQGIYLKHGLEVNLINYPAMPLIAKDLISGKLDFGQLIVPLVFAIHTGFKPFGKKTPMVITQIAGTNGAALTVRKGSGISKPDDFKGTIMANHSKLSVHYLINMMFLESYGLNYEKDLNLKVIKLDEIVDAMKDGKIDTFVMPEPKVAAVEAQGYGDVFLLSKYIWPNHPCCSLVTRRDFFEQNKTLAVDVTRAITESGLTVNNSKSRLETINILQSSNEYVYDKIPENVLQKAFTPGRSDFFPFPYQSSAILIGEIMKKYNLIASDIDPRILAQEVCQSDLSRQIMTELGAQPPKGNYKIEKILGKLKDYSM